MVSHRFSLRLDNFLYQGKEQDVLTGLYDFHARSYDPVLGRFLEIDPAKQFSNPYNGMGNNPVSMVDPTGEFVITILSKAFAGDLNGREDFGKATLVGSITEPFIATNIISDPVNSTSTSIGLTVGAVEGIFKNDWTKYENSSKIFIGQFYTDNNRSLKDEIWQGISRYTLETPQTGLGYNYSQWKNTFGQVDRVDYLGGATFVTNYVKEGNQGVSLGNFINIDNSKGPIKGSFKNYVKNNPLYMHEYGHTFDSQAFGPLYLSAIGVFSAHSAATSKDITNQYGHDVNTTHDFQWYEMSANRQAANYFGKHYGVDWNGYYTSKKTTTGSYIHYTIEDYYPRKK